MAAQGNWLRFRDDGSFIVNMDEVVAVRRGKENVGTNTDGTTRVRFFLSFHHGGSGGQGTARQIESDFRFHTEIEALRDYFWDQINDLLDMQNRIDEIPPKP